MNGEEEDLADSVGAAADVDRDPDPILDLAIEYAIKRTYPEGLSKERKRAVRKRAAKLVVDKGEVFLKRKGRLVKVVTDEKEQRRILQSCHADPTSGHFGMTKTWKRAAERFYWQGLSNQAKELVKYCPLCQRMNKKITTERPELHPVPVKSPWYHLGIDFVGPISPTSFGGNRYILTVSDYFTKFAWAKALPTKEAVNVVSALRELFYVMGLPSAITTDQGKEFHNILNTELMRVFGIKHRLTTAYHPQANGLDERFNQTLVNSLAKFVQDDRDTWDQHLQEVVYAYNTAVQESTKHTPFEAMFGRTARLPIDFNADSCYDADEKVEEFMDAESMDSFECAAKRQKTEQVIKENIKKAQAKQKRLYDLKHGAASCFNVGSLVLKKDFRRAKRKGGKLDYRWQGPYIITGSAGKGLFKLKQLNGDQVVKRVNGFHLKRYYQHSNTESNDGSNENSYLVSNSDHDDTMAFEKALLHGSVDDSVHVPSPLQNSYLVSNSDNGSVAFEKSVDNSIPPLPPPLQSLVVSNSDNGSVAFEKSVDNSIPPLPPPLQSFHLAVVSNSDHGSVTFEDSVLSSVESVFSPTPPFLNDRYRPYSTTKLWDAAASPEILETICASSSPIFCGGYYPDFFPPSADILSPILATQTKTNSSSSTKTTLTTARATSAKRPKIALSTVGSSSSTALPSARATSAKRPKTALTTVGSSSSTALPSARATSAKRPKTALTTVGSSSSTALPSARATSAKRPKTALTTVGSSSSTALPSARATSAKRPKTALTTVGSSSSSAPTQATPASTAPKRATTAPKRATTAPKRATTAPKRATTAPKRATTAPKRATTAPKRATTVSKRAPPASTASKRATPASTDACALQPGTGAQHLTLKGKVNVTVKAGARRKRPLSQMDINDGVVIDLDQLEDDDAPQPKQLKLQGEWLNDETINEGQMLIKEKFPHVGGLQNVLLGHTMAFLVETGEFVQVLHVNDSHWITISTIGCGPAEVDVFDSSTPLISTQLEQQIAAIICTDCDFITVRYRECQRQRGTSDCGVFALANASILASGRHPSSFLFDQAAMRGHLMNCISSKKFVEFPALKQGRERKGKVRLSETIEIYCTCRMPKSFSQEMVQCDQCFKWFHLVTCVKVNQCDQKWYCDLCSV